MDKLSYVATVLDNRIIIQCNDKNKFLFLVEIGAKRKFCFGTKWYLAYQTDFDLAKYFTKLREESFFFAYDQHGWGPSDIVRLLKKNNLVKGNFMEVFWRRGGETETRMI